mmetsp:Transcript_23283/g.74970  ORF Transcript_23283/g.74970 Transcript_23283/m.74970 type:complete len:207 (+) Transcript_23283:2108-2728(+)
MCRESSTNSPSTSIVVDKMPRPPILSPRRRALPNQCSSPPMPDVHAVCCAESLIPIARSNSSSAFTLVVSNVLSPATVPRTGSRADVLRCALPDGGPGTSRWLSRGEGVGGCGDRAPAPFPAPTPSPPLSVCCALALTHGRRRYDARFARRCSRSAFAALTHCRNSGSETAIPTSASRSKWRTLQRVSCPVGCQLQWARCCATNER